MTPLGLIGHTDVDKELVEASLPAYLMLMAVHNCHRNQIDLRADVAHHLDRASAAPFSGLHGIDARRVAQKVEDTTKTLLNCLDSSEPRESLYACALFTLRLVDEGFLSDQTNMAVMVALLLMNDLDDAENGTPDDAYARLLGTRESWSRKAGALHTRAALLGYFNDRRLRS